MPGWIIVCLFGTSLLCYFTQFYYFTCFFLGGALGSLIGRIIRHTEDNRLIRKYFPGQYPD